MSMTSKVNSTLRAAILASLVAYPKTNAYLYYSYSVNPNSAISLRKIQEATQKLSREGVIVRSNGGIFRLASKPVALSITATV